MFHWEIWLVHLDKFRIHPQAGQGVHEYQIQH